LRVKALYYPGFYTNILLASLLEADYNVCFNQRTLELQGPNRECFAKLRNIRGLYIVKHGEVIYALATDINLPSLMPPFTEPKTSTDTRDLWLRRLGQPNKRTLDFLPLAAPGVIISDKRPSHHVGSLNP
jgi:hypothetical protein